MPFINCNLLSEFSDFLVLIIIHIWRFLSPKVVKIEIFCHKNVAALGTMPSLAIDCPSPKSPAPSLLFPLLNMFIPKCDGKVIQFDV